MRHYVNSRNVKYFFSELRSGNKAITRLSELNDLGLIVDYKHEYALHIKDVVSKVSTRACLILKCCMSRDVATLLRVFKIYESPLLEYACSVMVCNWACTAQI